MNDDTIAAHLEGEYHQHRPITTAEVSRDLNSLAAEYRSFRHRTAQTLGFLGAIVGFESVFLIAWAVAR